MKKHDIFGLIWKSSYSIHKDTVNYVVKQIDDELRYLSTVALPGASGRQMKSVLSSIEKLRTHKAKLLSKCEKWSKTYDEKRMPRSGTEIDPVSSETEEKTYGLQNQRVKLASVNKSIGLSKKTILKDLYSRTWGTSTGLSDAEIDLMDESDVDKAIASLKNIYNSYE